MAGPEVLYEDDEVEEPEQPKGSWLSGRALIRLAIGGLVLLVATVLLVSYLQGPATPADNSVAAGLSRDMIDHHAQAVDMSTIVQRRTQADDIRYLTTDMALTQSGQIGMMMGWLDLWDLSVGRTGKPMQWMDNHQAEHELAGLDPADIPDLSTGQMPGMASQADINKLRTLPPDEADVLFLQLMIKHHQGAVAMARSAMKLTDVEVVVNLCRTIEKGQQSEIDLMEDLLAERDAAPL